MIHYFFRGSRASLHVNDSAPQVHELKIVNDSAFAGKSFLCQCVYDNRSVIGHWGLASGSQYATMNSNGKVEINSGVQSQTIEIHCEYGGMAASKQIVVTYDDNQLDIECASPVVRTSGNAVATYNSAQITPTWSVEEGQQYVTIDSSGNLAIAASGNAVIKAEWNTEDKFVHICGKDYTKTVDRALKCYTNDIGPLSLYEGSSQTALETVQVTNHIAQFTARTFSTGVEYRVVGVDASDSITFQTSN